MTPLYHPSQEPIPTSGGVYRITCIITGRFYIGSSFDLRKRYREHFNALRHSTHANQKMQRAFNKYGKTSFIFDVIEPILIPDLLIAREQHWIDKLCPFFNIAPIAGSTLGMKHTLEARAKMSASHRGQPNEHRIGVKHTPDACKKIGAAHLGKQESEETRRKKKESALKRPPPSRESIEKARLASLGRPISQETRAKLRISNTWRMKTVIVTSPGGDEYTVTGIRQFCKEHDLDNRAFTRVAKGKCSQHKGWKARYLE